jgi:hypothetical protein
MLMHLVIACLVKVTALNASGMLPRIKLLVLGVLLSIISKTHNVLKTVLFLITSR